MEVFAGFLAHTDAQIGRLLDATEHLGIDENTVVMYITGDNGASGEGTIHGAWSAPSFQNGIPEDPEWLLAHMEDFGTARCENHYNAGWAWALDSPFQWMKQVASHFGGTRNAMAVQWPLGIEDAGGLRSQFHHVIDVMPTILDIVGVAAPTTLHGIEQLPIQGTSMTYSFGDPHCASTRTTQYFEMLGNRALYHDGWIASCFHGRLPWNRFGRFEFDGPQERWELYHIENDFSQGHDLSDIYPEKLAELRALFDVVGRENNVFPLNEPGDMFSLGVLPPSNLGRLTSMRYTTSHIRMPERSVVNLKNCSFRITADLTLAEDTRGVVVAQGGNMAGWSLYVDEHRRPVYHYNWFGHEHFVATGDPIEPGHHELVAEFAYDGGLGGSGTLGVLVDGTLTAQVHVAKTVPIVFSISGETFDVGIDTGSPVGPYEHGFAFTGVIHSVLCERLSEPPPDIARRIAEGEFRASLATQ
jgi:arylsulfatase